MALDNSKKLEEDISIHIFTVSSAMVGVCLTVTTCSPQMLFYFSRRVCFPMQRCEPAVFGECIELNVRPTAFSSPPW
jgi:hypothetical protein